MEAETMQTPHNGPRIFLFVYIVFVARARCLGSAGSAGSGGPAGTVEPRGYTRHGESPQVKIPCALEGRKPNLKVRR